MPHRLRKGERRSDVYEREGVRWRCVWFYDRRESERRDPSNATTTAYLRRERDGPGRNTHAVLVKQPAEKFIPKLLDGVPFDIDPYPSVTFT